MKNIILITFFYCLASISLYAQTQLSLGYHKSFVGHNIRLGASWVLKDHYTVGLGIKYLQWQFFNNNPDAYTNRFRPSNFLEHWGLYGNIKYNILKREKAIRPFFYYDVSLTHAAQDLTGVFIGLGEYLINNDYALYLYDGTIVTYEAATVSEHNIGIGVDIKFNENWSLSQRIGAGFIFFHERDKIFNYISGLENWELARMFSTSLVYSFRKKQASKP